MNVSNSVPLRGCRHDVLGHALKAIGVLRAITECAWPEDCDPSAEGWWNPDTATFTVRSTRYPNDESLAEFFADKYCPTPIISAWNKSGGVTDKIEVMISGNPRSIGDFRTHYEAELVRIGLKRTKKTSKAGDLKFATESENRMDVERLLDSFNENNAAESEAPNDQISGVESQPTKQLRVAISAKTSGKKDGTLPKVAELLTSNTIFRECLELARRWVDDLQGKDQQRKDFNNIFVSYRDHLPDGVVECFDALSTVHLSRQNTNPLFVNRGQQGNTDIFRMNWEHFLSFRCNAIGYARASLFGERVVAGRRAKGEQKGKGTPFFPDAIKNYNQGLEWVTEAFPFCPLDYLLAVEGALAMRGAVSKSLGAQSRSFAAFPFVFEGTETLTDDQGDVIGLGVSFWLPVWNRPTTFGELHSFILDSQARLPKKECRFSSDFARSIRCQGVDAGFAAFQEFRFKMKGSRVPWVVSGRFSECSGTTAANVLNELLGPVDASGFLNQFEFHSSRDQEKDLHPLRVPALEAIENAVAEPDSSKILDVLCCMAKLNGHLARSKTLREDVGTGRVTFVPPLRCEEWSIALRDLEANPEFQIARALASIRGHEKQPDGRDSKVEPFLGSLLPLGRNQHSWFLPDPPSPQAVWTGIDLARDLASILERRVLDSASDVRPAVIGTCTTDISTILAFLRGELDDRRIASLVEALSLIGWSEYPGSRIEKPAEMAEEEFLDPIPVSYAAVRALLEIACQEKPRERAKTIGRSGPRADVQRTVSLVCRQESGLITAGVIEALRRLAIVGVPNTYSEDSRRQKPTLAGRDVIQLESEQSRFHCEYQLSRRLAAAVLIPLNWHDRWKLFRAVTLPQTTRKELGET